MKAKPEREDTRRPGREEQGKHMRIIFVRHGEPDYEHDCLTPTGRIQAAAAAERLQGEVITRIFSSPNGRARETAGYTAARLGLPVEVKEYLHEITWGGEGVPADGHPWTLSDRLITGEDPDFRPAAWREHPWFRDNPVTACYDKVNAGFDGLLLSLGYRWEGSRLLCAAPDTDRTVAVFSHGGSGACVLSRLLRLPFPYVLSVLPYDYTSIIIIELPDRPGEAARPRLELFNDIAHIRQTRDTRKGPALQQMAEERGGIL